MRGWSVIIGVCGQLLAVGISHGQCAPGFDEDGSGRKPSYWFMGGDFNVSLPNNSGCAYLGRFDGTPLSRVREGNTGTLSGPVYAMVVFDDDGPGPNSEALFVCGAFQNAGRGRDGRRPRHASGRTLTIRCDHCC